MVLSNFVVVLSNFAKASRSYPMKSLMIQLPLVEQMNVYQNQQLEQSDVNQSQSKEPTG